MNVNPTLLDKRSSLNSIDKEIQDLLTQRFEIVHRIGEYKKKNQMTIYDKAREETIYHNIQNECSSFKINIHNVYREILRQSRDIQQNINMIH